MSGADFLVAESLANKAFSRACYSGELTRPCFRTHPLADNQIQQIDRASTTFSLLSRNAMIARPVGFTPLCH